MPLSLEEKLLKYLLAPAAFVFCLWAASCGFWNEVSHVHGFRQAQTLISIQRMLAGGPLLFNELPVMGEPSRLPHEFPFFDWLVVIASKVSAIGILPLARGISFFFWLACIAIAGSLLKKLQFDFFVRGCFLVLALASPLYIHWSRAPIGESVVLLFSLLHLRLILLAREKGSIWTITACSVTGVIAALAKSLTYFAYFPLALIFLCSPRFGKRPAIAWLVPRLLLPFCSALAWTWIADSWKLLNPIAATVLASGPLLEWMIGPWTLRFEASTWSMIRDRAFADLLGNGWAFFAAVAAAALFRARDAGFLLIVFVLPFLVLTHIYSTHYYYPFSVGLELLAAVAILLGIFQRKFRLYGRMAAALSLLTLLGMQIERFTSFYLPLQTIQNKVGLDFGRVLSSIVKEDELIMVYGWSYSSEVTYFSGRRTVMNPGSLPLHDPVIQEVLERSRPRQLAAVAFCLSGTSPHNAPLAKEAVSTLGLRPEPLKHLYANCQIYYRPDRARPESQFL